MTRPVRLLCTALVLTGAVAGCSTRSESPSVPSSAASSGRVSAQGAATGATAGPGLLTGSGAAALRTTAGAPSAAVTTVQTAHGYDGAVADSSKVTFWTSPDATRWTSAGAVTYPATSTALILRGAVPSGATHAVFVVDGLTGGSLHAALFGNDGHGWRGLTMTDDLLRPTATTIDKPDGPGTYVSAEVDSRGVRTSATWGPGSTAPQALQVAHPLVTTWTPAGPNFRAESTNVFTARTTAAVATPSAAAVPAGTDKDGTYVVRINSVDPTGRLAVQPVKPVACTDPESRGCYDASGAPLTLQFAADAETTVVSATYNIVNVTAPPWLWVQVNGRRTTVLTPDMFTAGAPYVVPKGLVPSLDGVDTALITVRGGKIVKADSLFHP